MMRWPAKTRSTPPARETNPRQTDPRSERRDEQLVCQYAATGDRLAFEELVRRYERPIYRYLRGYLHDAQLAEDASQATFLQLHLKSAQFQPDRRFRPWLYTIANNTATDLLRRNRRHRNASLDPDTAELCSGDARQLFSNLPDARAADPSKHMESIEDYQEARHALERLPTKLREVLELVAYDGLKYGEAADALGIPLGTVKSRMNKALRTMRAALTAEEHPPSELN
jgi:RNA polymerase sigma-70 factor, ECF subfamily